MAGPTSESLDPLRCASILVTGAGGSIGSALSMRLAGIGPRQLLLVDSSEQAMHRLQTRMELAHLEQQPKLLLGNAGDAALLTEILETYRPRFVFHAAAYKQVPLLEQNPLEAIENNALNTYMLAECAGRFDGIRVVLLSTDKAVEPVSILGAAKRIAELITVAHRGVAVRLGNVLGSEGSVSETFLRQIANCGPITITGREQRRYFLTCEEAVDLLLVCAVEAPDGAINAPALDRQYSISSLAEFLAETIAAGQMIPVLQTEARPGDKAYEKLWSTAEKAVPGTHRAYLQLLSEPEDAQRKSLATNLQSLQAVVSRRDRIAALEVVRRLVPDYVPSAALLSAISSRAAGAV